MVLDFLAIDNFDFTRKIVKKIWGEKLVKMLGFRQNWIFGQKIEFSNSVWEKFVQFFFSKLWWLAEVENDGKNEVLLNKMNTKKWKSTKPHY